MYLYHGYTDELYDGDCEDWRDWEPLDEVDILRAATYLKAFSNIQIFSSLKETGCDG